MNIKRLGIVAIYVVSIVSIINSVRKLIELELDEKKIRQLEDILSSIDDTVDNTYDSMANIEKTLAESE